VYIFRKFFLGGTVNLRTVVKQSALKASIALVLTVFIYQFYRIEFLRSSIEDAAFDTTSWFALSKTVTDTNQSNTFVLMVDDKYLRSQNLLDENNETTYGYIFPREYLTQIIKNVDTLVSDLDEENYPYALFLDYDFSYLSDPNNKVTSGGDVAFINILKSPRPYIIYLPITSNYNFVYHSKDKDLQTLISKGKIRFVSVGLTSASDGVSRRYYPYEIYKDWAKSDKKFPYIAIELYAKQNNLDENIIEDFSQEGIALVENRIIFKDKKMIENGEYSSWQSNWKKLSGFSANYPLDMIYEEDIKDAVFMVGAAHNASEDTFEIDAFSKEISGVEMHANALATLSYLGGKLKRLSPYWSAFIVFVVVFFVDILLGVIYNSLIKFKKSLYSKRLQEVLSFLIHDEEEDFHEFWLLVISMGVLFVISYNLLLLDRHYWFNWMIPALMYLPYLMFMGLKKIILK
jgi:hypothetical protein